MRKKSFISVLILFVFLSMNSFANLKVVYPNVNGEGEKLFGYAVLKLALDNSGVDYELVVTKERVNNERIRSMISDNIISISDFGTSPEFEKEFLPVYFPIDLGLNGWRIFLIHKDTQSIFDKVKKISNLQKMVAGQGLGWSDVDILENAGLKVQKAPTIDSLFSMIQAKRFDYFPLGANEAHSLLNIYKKLCPDVIVDSDIVLIYPFGRLFFVNKNNKELRDAVLTGLKKAFDNGSFWSLFKNHESNAALFTLANLKNRLQIRIDNPYMTKEFGQIPKKYFFNLDMLDK